MTTVSIRFVIHLYLLLYLFKQPLSRSLTQVEVVSKLLNDFTRVIILKNFDFLDVFAVKFDLEDANGLLHDWQVGVHEGAKWSLLMQWWRLWVARDRIIGV